MTPFFDPLRCPICDALLPRQPLRCPECGVELIGPTVRELAETLRRADVLANLMRARLTVPDGTTPTPQPQPQPPSAAPPQILLPVSRPPRRSWFAGRSVGVILLILGALCVLAAGVVFVAVTWVVLPLAVRTLTLILITVSFAVFAHVALRRGLQATAEAMAVTASGMFVLDLVAARRAGLLGLADLATGPYEIVTGTLLIAVATAGAMAVRSRQRWLRSLDAAVAAGMAVVFIGLLNVDRIDLAVSTVVLTVIASTLYAGWRRLRFPVSTVAAAVLGALAWSAAVGVGAGRAADVAADPSRLVAAWPALVVAVVAALWSVRLTHPGWARVAAGLGLLPVVLVAEIIGWSHGWVVGAAVMLVGYAVAALASGHVSANWSPAVGGTALVLGLSAVFGLLPTMIALGTRLELARTGSWPGTAGLPDELRVELWVGQVGPWLLPVTVLVVLALLPSVTIGRHRLRVDQHVTAGVFVAALALMPLLYGAGFWVSITSLVLAATLVVCAARLWHNDVLLVPGLLLLAIMRICASYDGVAAALAWAVIALVCLGWALTESRQSVRVGFQLAAGLAALLAVMAGLTFWQAPRPFQGLVIVVVGSLGLLASQWLLAPPGSAERAVTRLVGEGISAAWVVAGLALADTSPSHRALELTVAGVAAGITAYVSQDRRGAGWVSGGLLTLASWIRLADNDVQAVEWYTLPAAAALLVYGARRLRRDPGASTWRTLGPGMALALTPSLVRALAEPVSMRGLLVALASLALVALGVSLRLAAPFALGVVATGLLALRNIWPLAAFVPRWTLLFLVGGTLLVTGMTWESRVNDVRTAGRYVRGLR